MGHFGSRYTPQLYAYAKFKVGLRNKFNLVTWLLISKAPILQVKSYQNFSSKKKQILFLNFT